MKEPTPKVCHYSEVGIKEFGDMAPGVKMRALIDEENDGAPHYALRLFEVEPGGNTPDHSHSHEHENFIVEGRGQVRLHDEWHDVGPGSVVFVPPGVRHQYRNAGDKPFLFLCGVPISRYRTS